MAHHPPELEAVELEAVGWFVRTKRTDQDSAGWLIADCSTAAHGKEWARLFAAAPKLLEALKAVVSVADRATDEFDKAHAAIAAVEGRTELSNTSR